MGRQLRLTYKSQKFTDIKFHDAGKVIMTDPMDEETGVASTWGLMVENMSVRGRFNKYGEFVAEWRES